MPIHAWVVLILTLVALLAGLLWMLVLGRLFWRWPKGERATYHRDPGSKVHIIASTKPSKLLQSTCDVALTSTVLGWNEARLPPAAGGLLSEVAIWFRPRADFPNKSVAAYRTDLERYIGDQTIPLFVIREENMAEVLGTGEPLIHEALHQLCRLLPGYIPNSGHQEPGVWVQSSGDLSAQRAAQRSFKLISKALDP